MILDYIKEAFRKTLPTLNWMDEKTKQIALEKLAAVSRKIGYPDITQDLQRLESYYDKVESLLYYYGYSI